MRKLAPRLLAVVAAPFLASCVFLLDYDDLQGGSVPNDGGTTATGGAAAGGMSDIVGGVGASGEAGSSSSCGDCNDHDACTVDTCDETGDAPTCTHEATEGLKLDGFETTLTSLRHVRVSVVAGGQQF